MRPDSRYPWGPKDDLGDLIARVPYHRTDATLTGRIMGELKPKRPGWRLRLVAWLRSPVTFSLSPAYALSALLVFCLSVVTLGYHWQGQRTAISVARQKASGIPVVFQFNDASARSVALMGSFNNWDSKGYEMRRQIDTGKWGIELRLSPGRHDYVFLVDGKKVSPDPKADLIQKDDFGNRNSVMFIKGGHGQEV